MNLRVMGSYFPRLSFILSPGENSDAPLVTVLPAERASCISCLAISQPRHRASSAHAQARNRMPPASFELAPALARQWRGFQLQPELSLNFSSVRYDRNRKWESVIEKFHGRYRSEQRVSSGCYRSPAAVESNVEMPQRSRQSVPHERRTAAVMRAEGLPMIFPNF
jgi:hypothetical protein